MAPVGGMVPPLSGDIMPGRFARSIVGAALAWLAAAAPAGELTLYSGPAFKGREVTVREVTPDLAELGWQEAPRSLVVRSGRWELCPQTAFRGRCLVVERGEYRKGERALAQVASAREVGTGRDKAGWRLHAARTGLLDLYAGAGLGGNSTRLLRDARDLVQHGFNNRARGAVVERGNWMLCSEAEYRGHCQVFTPGRYPDLGAQLAGTVSSARTISDDEVHAPRPQLDPTIEVALYAEEGLRGRMVPLQEDIPDFTAIGFNDAAASLVIQSGTWEFCVDARFHGPCRVLGPGIYRTLDDGFARAISSLRMVAAPGGLAHPAGDVELFSGPDFAGARLPLRADIADLREWDFNNRAASLIVHRGEWEFCEDLRLAGRCVSYGPGRYGRLGMMDLRISSLRRVR
jgi:hypothetical protein